MLPRRPITIRTTFLAPRTLLIPLPILLNIRRRRKLALRANLLAIQIEEDRHRRQQHRHTPDQRASPLDAHTLKHLRREQGEDAAKDGSHECICCDGGGGEHEVCVDDIVE